MAVRREERPTSGEASNDLAAALRQVRRRWTTFVAAKAVARAAVAAAAILGCLALLDVLRPPSAAALLPIAALTLVTAALTVAWFLRPVVRRPTSRQVARYIEERCPELEDRIAVAAEVAGQPAAGPFRSMVLAEAVRKLDGVDPDRLVQRDSLRRALMLAGASAAVLVVSLALARAPLARAARTAWWYAFPGQIVIDVTPGDIRLPAGRPLRIVAAIQGAPSIGTATLTIGEGDDRRSVAMTAVANGYQFEIPSVTRDFTYAVSAGSTTSREFSVTALQVPRVERIDVHYQYPAFSGLRARVEEDGGDIYAPAGTEVRLEIHPDRPVKEGELVMLDGVRSGLAATATGTLETTFRVDEDGSYRVSLTDVEGLQNPGETEYFIRTMDDRPPEVRVLRPGGDRQVTPLEEVTIEARADDDYGVERLDLIYSVRGGPERTVRLPGPAAAPSVTGSHTLFVEDLGVQPGDFITYYARARDVGRAKRSTEARSDIFFLEVKPFAEEFVASQSQAMMGGGSDRSLEDLAAVQKEIIIATWKLDRRSTGGKSTQDIKTVARAQGELRVRAEQAMVALGGRPGAQQRRGRQREPEPTDEPLKKAVEAMGRAESALDGLRTSEALPPEMEALNQLLKAQAEVRRRQVARQQAGGWDGNNRNTQDLSSLFDRELQRQQETNYETRNSAQDRQESGDNEDSLTQVRELARRQDEINRRERELAQNREQLSREELKRQLERLTREQSELRRQAEELSRQLARLEAQESEQQSQDGRGKSSTSSQGTDGEMRDVSEEMRSAASELRREDAREASARGERALERLREIEKRLQGNAPDERRRTLGEAQLEAQQIAEAQRRVASEARRLGNSPQSGDAVRRLAGEKERLADRVDQLQERLEQLAGGATGDDRRALADASGSLDRERVAERMREGAASLRKAEQQSVAAGANSSRGSRTPTNGEQAANAGSDRARTVQTEQQLAEALERIADQVGSAGSTRDAESRRLSAELDETRDLRERLREAEQRLEDMASQEARGASGSPASESDPSGRPSASGTPGSREATGANRGGRGTPAASPQPGAGGQTGTAELEAQQRRDAQATEELINQLRAESGAMGGTPEEHRFSLSAPGTEAFKQDFAKWEVLRKEIALALERREVDLSQRLAAKATQDRLNAGADQRMPEEYRKLVAKYYQALASRTKQ
jgi:hypothetical protein